MFDCQLQWAQAQAEPVGAEVAGEAAVAVEVEVEVEVEVGHLPLAAGVVVEVVAAAAVVVVARRRCHHLEPTYVVEVARWMLQSIVATAAAPLLQ